MPINFNINDLGSWWVYLQWIPAFDGNRRVLYFRIQVTWKNTEESKVIQDVVNVQLDMYRYDIQLCDMHHVQYMYVNVSAYMPLHINKMTYTHSFSFNVTTNILPFTTYEFQVSACNAIGCGSFTGVITTSTEQDGRLCDVHVCR